MTDMTNTDETSASQGMTMTSEEYAEWDELIGRAARSMNREYHYIEVDDLKQELWVEVLLAIEKGKPDTLLSPAAKNCQSALRFKAKSLAEKQRKQHLTISSQYAYRTRDVRKLLKTFFDRRQWMNAETPDDAQSEQGGNVKLEMSSDLSRAWDKLHPNYKALIWQEHVGGGVEREMRWKLTRSYQKMADLVNSYVPMDEKVGRRAISNSAAQAVIQNDYSPSGMTPSTGSNTTNDRPELPR